MLYIDNQLFNFEANFKYASLLLYLQAITQTASMKKILIPILVFVFTAFEAHSQNLVSTAVLPRNAVLEMFNGINCAYCPDGDIRATQLANAFPGRVAIIIIHTGALADTLPGQPDYRTPFGAAIDSLSGSIAYPAGTMNRQVWPGTYSQPPYFPQNPPNNLAIRRQGWWDGAYPTTGAGAAIILNGGNTPVNIGAETVWNAVTRELAVHVELYYTSTETQNNKLNVAFLESSIIGLQSTLAGYDSNYVHDHMLRHLLTGQWGDTISTTTQGTLISRNYTYTVPVGFNIDNSDIVVFVTQNDNKTTHTSATIPAKNGTTVGLNEIVSNHTVGVYPNPVAGEINISGLDKNVSEIKIINLLGKTLMEIDPGAEFITENISALPSGIYFVSIKTPSTHITKKFIKQ